MARAEGARDVSAGGTGGSGTETGPKAPREFRQRLVRALVLALSFLGGAVSGFCLALAIVVARARAGHYILDLTEIAVPRWETLPIPIGGAAGLVLGVRRPGAVDRAALWGFGASIPAAALGFLVGRLVWGPGEGEWAGGIVLGALGLVGGQLGSLWCRPERTRSPREVPVSAGLRGGLALLALGLVLAFGTVPMAGGEPEDLPAGAGVALPPPSEVEAVVFLVGDAGETIRGRSPLLEAMAGDVEAWSAALGRDGAVSVVFLGDLVYPSGVRDREHRGFRSDSTRLWNQIELLGGPSARSHATAGFFLPGNHDWGNVGGEEGIRRVANLAAQIEEARRAGYRVELLPSPPTPGPATLDSVAGARFVFLDTHWFLQAASPADRQAFLSRIGDVLAGAGSREVIILAHHPYISGGPHGTITPGHHAGGVGYLLKRSGTLAQDLNSAIYAELRAGLGRVFAAAERPPLVFAAGHDHSLQVFRGDDRASPQWTLVSGAGSELTPLRRVPGMVWGASRPGYMLLLFRSDGGVQLFVKAGDPERVVCSGTGEQVAECMRAGIAAFRAAYSASLLNP